MSLGIIEINDSGIQVAVDTDLVLTSPGYAVMDGEKLLIGEQGAQFARLLPTWTNNRFWNQLNTDPIANATTAVLDKIALRVHVSGFDLHVVFANRSFKR